MPKRQRSRATSAADKVAGGIERQENGANGERLEHGDFVPQTELGRRLWKIRQRIVNSGQPLLDWQGIEREVRERRGEASGRA